MADHSELRRVMRLQDLLIDHVGRFFSNAAVEALVSTEIRFIPYQEASSARGHSIVIPTDGQAHVVDQTPWRVGFNGTTLTLWNRLRAPQGDDWTAVPSPATPLWYVHSSGSVMPAWDVFGTLSGLLELEEETGTARDKHGRALAANSPRRAAGLLEVPAVNEAAAAMVALAMADTPDACLWLSEGALRSPLLVLSHDVDVLMGNDPWGQFMRLGGAIAPLARLRPPRWDYVRLIAENWRNPKRYYMDDIARMIDAESAHGYRSAFYFLMGRRGLYGPRYGLHAIREALSLIPAGWVAGIHYSYYSYMRDDAFGGDVSSLTQVSGQAPLSGRAHYLRHDPARSPAFLARFGIIVDESIGYPDAVGYRAGIAGPYRIPDVTTPDGRPMTEMPLVVMDGPLLEYDDPAATFERLLRHLSRIGGALSLLTHPGTMDNPQRPKARGLYRDMLATASDLGFVGVPAESLIGEMGDAR